jgi:hypothetical protein
LNWISGGLFIPKIDVQGTEVTILSVAQQEDFICLTDMARYKDSLRTDYIIQNWLRNRNTIEFLGVWERMRVSISMGLSTEKPF